MKISLSNLNGRLILILILVFHLSPIYTQANLKWQEIQTVEEVCQAYPERMNALLQTLNLELEGLEKVKAAFEEEKTALACQFLLDYYQHGKTAAYLRRDLPPFSKNTDANGDTILQNIFTFYTQQDRVPENENGSMDWFYQGPDQDIEWAWALNRHFHIRTLLEAYFKTGAPKYAETIDRHIKDWVINSVPYPGVKSSTAMWRGLEVSFRVKAWAPVFYSLIDSENFSPATRLLLLSSIPEHTHYLHHFHGQGNWLTMEMSALAMAATAWPEFEDAPAWMAYTKKAMTESLKEQIYPDGVQTELTAHYHYVALTNFELFLKIFQQAEEDLSAAYIKEMEKMWHYLAYTMRPDGHNILNNDSDRKNYQELVSQAATAYQREDWRYIASNGKKGVKPDGPPSIVFPWAGQHIMRSGYEPGAQWAFFDIGPWGSGHQHNDKLHLSISAYGRDLLVDGGRFAYRGAFADKFRRYAVSSESHNVLLIDGKGQGPGPKVAEEPLTEKHYKITEELDYAWGDFDQFRELEGSAKHTRSLSYVRGKFWIVVDQVATDRPRQIEALWHWHPDCEIVVQKKNNLSSNNDKGNLSIIPVGAQKWRISQIKGQEMPQPQGWYSEEYNKAEPNVASIYTTDIEQNSAFVWLLYPSEGKAPKVKAKILSQQADAVTVRVKSPEGKWTVFVPFSNSAKANIKVK